MLLVNSEARAVGESMRYAGDSAHHHGEDDGSRRRLDHPEQHQAGELGDGEQVDLSQRDVTQVDEVRLVLCRHAEQLEAVEELQNRGGLVTEEVKNRVIGPVSENNTLILLLVFNEVF